MLPKDRPHMRYEGKPRVKVNKRTGRLEARSPRAFSTPKHAIIWLESDQSTAVERGYFLERLKPHNDVRVASLTGRNTEAQVCVELERAAFNNDRHSLKALLFIEQQDKSGWSGAWASPAIEKRSTNLRWFKNICETRHAGRFVLREHYKAMANKRWSNSVPHLT